MFIIALALKWPV
jgi:hypothetical protein